LKYSIKNIGCLSEIIKRFSIRELLESNKDKFYENNFHEGRNAFVQADHPPSVSAASSELMKITLWISSPQCHAEPHYWIHKKCEKVVYLDNKDFSVVKTTLQTKTV